MGQWKSRGLRGSVLEEMINSTNKIYENHSLCLVQKVPTPIVPMEIDNSKRLITKAYFESKSTVDYIGVAQGIPICFDAKETSHNRLPLQNIHKHQIEFMENFEKQNGIAFFIVYFTKLNKIFYLPFIIFKKYFDKSLAGGRKSIPLNAFPEDFLIYNKQGYLVHYLETLNKDLEKR
ncbi:MAG: Holliday junction resolvase RecU [Lachnospirales bacterium]